MSNMYIDAMLLGIKRFNDGRFLSPLEDADFLDLAKERGLIRVKSWKQQVKQLMPEEFGIFLRAYEKGYTAALVLPE